jgi:hypothetical protein
MNYFETEDGKLAARVLWRNLSDYFATMDPRELEELDRRIVAGRWFATVGQQRELTACVKDCYTLEEAAPILGRSVAVLLRLARSKQLGAFKSKGLGNVWYIWRGTVEAELRRRADR